MEVVAGLAGGQPQVLLGIAEIELDLEAVAIDAVDLLRCHLRGGGEEGHQADLLLWIGVDVQDEGHLQQALEGLADQLRMVQSLALVRQVDGGQVGDAGAVEVPGVRDAQWAARSRVPTGQRCSAACSRRSPLTMGRIAVVAVPHEDPDVGTVLHGPGRVQHDRHLGLRRVRAPFAGCRRAWMGL